MTTAVIPTNNVQGDITSCGIETRSIQVERNGAFAFTERTTYQSYNLCSKETIREYSVDGLTFGGGIVIVFFCFVALILLASIGASITNNW